MTPIECKEWLERFLEAWTDYAHYIQSTTGISPADIQICKDTLTALKSEAPHKLIEELIEGKVSKRTLDDAEEFDRALNRLRIVPLPINETQKKELEIIGVRCISLYRFILEMSLKMRNMMVE